MVDGVVAIVGGGGGKRGGIPGRSIPEGTDPASDTSVEDAPTKSARGDLPTFPSGDASVNGSERGRRGETFLALDYN